MEFARVKIFVIDKCRKDVDCRKIDKTMEIVKQIIERNATVIDGIYVCSMVLSGMKINANDVV